MSAQNALMFHYNNKYFCALKSDGLYKRIYTLNGKKGYPWLTYTGNDRTLGAGILCPSLCSPPDKTGRQYLFSSGPWWVDGNHAPPGYGYLSLVFLCLLRPDKLKGFFDSDLSFPNMQDMVIRGKLRGHNVELNGADFLFWFQCYCEETQKNINYALTAQPLNKKLLGGNVNDFELRIDVRNVEEWTCLGSCAEKSDLYGEFDLAALDTTAPVDMGFILAPLDVQPLWRDEVDLPPTANVMAEYMWPIDTRRLPQGTIALLELEIEYYSHYEIIEVPPTPEVKAYFAQQSEPQGKRFFEPRR